MKRSTKITVGAMIAVAMAMIPLTSNSKSSAKESKKIILSSDNTIVLNDAIEGSSVAEVILKAKELDSSGLLAKVGLKSKKPIYLFLRTPGGEVQTGLEMVEALRGLNREVDTVTMFAASMGFQTVQQLGKRYIFENGVLMSHRAQGGFEGEFGGQKGSQVDNRKGFWEQRVEEMDQRTVERTNGKQTMESYQKAYAGELWLTGRQAVEQGYADSVANVQCDSSLSGVTSKSINFMGLVNITYDLDNCPLNSSPMNIRIGQVLTNKGLMKMQDFMDKNGGFGTTCLVASGADANKVCASDTTLSLERLVQLKDQFRSYYTNIRNRTIPLDVGYASDRVRL